jgi:hypothetical protein
MAAAQNQQQHQNAIRETSLSLPFDLLGHQATMLRRLPNNVIRNVI